MELAEIWAAHRVELHDVLRRWSQEQEELLQGISAKGEHALDAPDSTANAKAAVFKPSDAAVDLPSEQPHPALPRATGAGHEWGTAAGSDGAEVAEVAQEGCAGRCAVVAEGTTADAYFAADGDAPSFMPVVCAVGPPDESACDQDAILAKDLQFATTGAGSGSFCDIGSASFRSTIASRTRSFHVRGSDSPVLKSLRIGEKKSFFGPRRSAEVEACPVTAQILSSPRVDVIHTSRLHRAVLDIVLGKPFEFLVGIVIFANAAFTAFMVDYDRAHLDTETPAELVLVENIFTIFYTIEIVLRIYGYRGHFFVGEDMRWNLFDTALAVISLADQLLISFVVGGVNVSFFRVLRIMKIIKLLRVVRLMRCFKGLRVVLNGILGSMQAMFYATILMLVTAFTFGTAIMQCCNSYLMEGADDAAVEGIAEVWGSVLATMHTLFAACTSGDSWRHLAAPLDPLAYTVFLVYLFFFVFIITNTLTSLFVENSIQFSQADEKGIIQEELDKKDRHITKLRRFFNIIDSKHTGSISYDDFKKLASPQLVAFASSIGIDILDAKEFFEVLSCGGAFDVDLEAFVVGCIKMRGPARSLDVLSLGYWLQKEGAKNEQRYESMLVMIGDIAARLR